MTDDRKPRVHERWAHLRFSIVGPLLAAPPGSGELQAELKMLAGKSWLHPVTGEPVKFGVSTIERWFYQAKRTRTDPVGALRKKTRVDKDFTEFYERLRVLRREREGGMEHLLMAMATGYDYRKYQRGKTADKKTSS